MRFLITWTLNAGSEADQAWILDLFAKWQPPIELNEWSGFADGSGGMCLAETDDVDMLARITTTWSPWLHFTVQPLQPIQQTAAVMAEAAGFRSSVA